LSRAGAAAVGPLAVVSDQLLAGIGDMSAKGGEEIESGTGGRGGRMRAGAAIPILGIVGDLADLSVIVQSMQSNGRMDTISGHAFPRLMVIGRDGPALKYGEARMAPGEKDVDQALVDFLLCQQTLQELVAKQEHDLDRIGPRKRGSGGVVISIKPSWRRMLSAASGGRVM